MKKASITLELPELTAESVMDAIVKHYRHQLDDQIKKILAENVKAATDKSIQAQADKAVADFLKKTIPQTNQWGEKTGADVGITEYILKSFEKYMQMRVDADGRNTSYDRGVTRHAWLVEAFGLKQIEKVAAEEIKKVKQAAELQISAAVGAFIAQNMVAPVAAIALPKSN